ncbi:MAG: cupin domain-containing protein [Rhodanobacteraceae bacterium]
MRAAEGASTLPIEVHARGEQSLGMEPVQFLRDYWQKRPLLVRGAIAAFQDPLDPDDLAGLACEELALARIVERSVHDSRARRKRDPRVTLSVRYGPFAEADFARLPKTGWTLLVQDVDKWDADVATLLDRFAFLPRWRIDDVMVSYAERDGSVGPHVDQYDVFLLQGLGRRRWRIDTRSCTANAADPHASAGANPAHPVDGRLALLRHFIPTHEWILETGDMLYLPPAIAHHGVALAPCMTYSIGMRAPAQSELLLDFAAEFAETMPETLRLADPDLMPTRNDGEIDEATMTRVLQAMPWLRSGTHGQERLRRWFGRFITRYRSAQVAVRRLAALTDAAFEQLLHRNALLRRNPWSRFAWARAGRGAVLFVAGEEYPCSSRLARIACAQTEFACTTVAPPRDRETLRKLIDAGHLVALRANLPLRRRKS